MREQGAVVFDSLAFEVKGACGTQFAACTVVQMAHVPVQAGFAVNVAVVGEFLQFAPVDVIKAQDGAVGEGFDIEVEALSAEAAADIGVLGTDGRLGSVNVAIAVHVLAFGEQAA